MGRAPYVAALKPQLLIASYSAQKAEWRGKENLPLVEFELFAMSAWAIWKDICNMKHNTKPTDSIISIEWVASFLNEFKRARMVFGEQSLTNIEEDAKRWTKAPMAHYRLDVDAGFRDDLGRYSTCAVIKDHYGHIVAATACSIRNPGTVLAEEIKAIHSGILLALRMKISNVRIFSDSITAVRMISDPSEFLNSDGSLLCDILTFIKSDRVLQINHVYRSANKVVLRL
ncbi:uncharacterized protein [Primulina eburnea]|uniref:uncharacterized protein n=1 Tax=Primulina eburnea TaxID=1245227 RepID=UPI003C6C03B7